MTVTTPVRTSRMSGESSTTLEPSRSSLLYSKSALRMPALNAYTPPSRCMTLPTSSPARLLPHPAGP